MQCQVSQSISYCHDIGGLFNGIDDGWLEMTQGRKMSDCPQFSGVGDSGISGMDVVCWHNWKGIGGRFGV